MPANSNNTIEEFFIKIGMDASQAQKAVKELDGLTSKIKKQQNEIAANEKKLADQKAKQAKAQEKIKNKKLKQSNNLAKQEALLAQKESVRKEKERLREEAREQRHQKALDNIRKSMFRKQAYFDLRDMSPERAKGFRERADRLVNAKDLEGLKDLSAELNRTTNTMKRHTRATIGIGVAQQGLADSTRNMIRSYASLFAIMEGTQAIKRVGMEMQGMEVGLAAVVGEGKAAQEELAFLREESMRLGFDLAKTSKSYVKLFAAAEGKASVEEIRRGFISVMEAATVFQLSADDTNRAIKGIQQMFSKSGIYAEELK